MVFSLVKNIKTKIQDMRTISRLCLGAEKYANSAGEEKPGAEHFMLSALDLPDGTARKVFERLKLDQNEIDQAIEKQHIDALNKIGIDAKSIKIDSVKNESIKRNTILYDSQPSAQLLMQKLFQNNKNRNVPLVGAHVLEVIASMEYGIAARTLKAMGVEQFALQKVVEDELQHMQK
jgi:ATP-dependent Clp protease ATP-binding subunit ClpA